jgi:hypothetical protein
MNNEQRMALIKIAAEASVQQGAMPTDPTLGQSIGASFESFKTGLKDKFNPKAWIGNALTGGNYTNDRKLAARQQYYAKQAAVQQQPQSQPQQQPQPQQAPAQQ